MKNTHIRGLDGKSMAEWGGPEAWMILRAGGLIASLEWAKLGGTKTERVCVVGRDRQGIIYDARPSNLLVNTHTRVYREQDRPYMIKFNRDGTPTGSASAVMLQDAAISIALMGYDSSDRTAYNHYVDVVIKAMAEMVYQPPAPPEVARKLINPGGKLFEVTATNSQTGQVLAESAI